MTVNTFGPINTQSAFLPPEQDFPEDPSLMREILAQRERITATVLNVKETAQYEEREIITGQQWFSQVVSGAIKTNYGYRLTFDLVALNGGSIANGSTTTISLPTDPTMGTPTCIQYANGLIPLHGFGAGTGGTTYYFINDPSLYVEFTNTSTTVQSISITNNTGSAITQCYWVFEYLKF
jgi:hypothetical protein